MAVVAEPVVRACRIIWKCPAAITRRLFGRSSARRPLPAWVLLLAIAASTTRLDGQNVVQYVYDELGRLVAVIAPSGEAAVYTYDAVGNLLSIARKMPTQVSIIGFTPHSGPVGATVTINGTGFTGAMGAFKTPTLREVTKHAPYMHDGSIGTLLEVVMFYNQGGTRNPFLDSRIRPLNLTDVEINSLLAFLQGLEGEGYQDVAPPAFPR